MACLGWGYAALQASLLSSSGHTPTFDLEQGPSRQGGSVVCRLQARLFPLWAPAPHPGAFPTLSQKAFTQAGSGCLVMPGRRQTRSCPWPHGSFLRGATWSVTSQLQKWGWDPDASLETQAPPSGPGAPLGSRHTACHLVYENECMRE